MPVKLLLVLVAFFTLLAFLMTGTRSSSQENVQIPSIVNRTKAFKVLNVSRSGKEAHVSLKNNYDQHITAYAVSIGSFRFTEEFIYSEIGNAESVGIAPQEIYERTIPFPTSVQTDLENTLIIQAVVLADGTGDGNSLVVQDINDERLGGRIQIERTLKVITKYLSLSTELDSELEYLKLELESVLTASDNETNPALRELRSGQPVSISERVRGGLKSGKEETLRKIKELERIRSVRPIRDELLRIKETYERVLRRF